jgi:CheY-like chemotaxis protein
LTLAKEPAAGPTGAVACAWKVLVVDDEQEIHTVTRLALDGFEFSGRGLQLISAYSGMEARNILASE